MGWFDDFWSWGNQVLGGAPTQPQQPAQPPQQQTQSQPQTDQRYENEPYGVQPENVSPPPPQQQVQQQAQTIDRERTQYAPASEQSQVELRDTSVVVDRISGEVGYYQELPRFPGQPVRRIGTDTMINIGGGGYGAAQSGMYTQGGAISRVVVEQRTNKLIVPAFSYVQGDPQAVLKEPEKFSRLGAEAYGGMVLPLDDRRLSPGTQMGRYPVETGNLANLVNPQGVNAPKSEYAGNMQPWTLPEGSAPISFIGKGGVITPAPNAMPSPQQAPPTIPQSELMGLPAPFRSREIAPKGDFGLTQPFQAKTEQKSIRSFKPDLGYTVLTTIGMAGGTNKPIADILKFKTSPGVITETRFGMPQEMPSEETRIPGTPTIEKFYDPTTGTLTTITTTPEIIITKGGTITPVTTTITPVPSAESNLLKDWDKKMSQFSAGLPSKEVVTKSGYVYFHTTEENAPPLMKGIVGGVGAGYEWVKEHPVTFAERYGEAYAGGLIFRGVVGVSEAGKVASVGTKYEPIAKGLNWGITKAAPWVFGGLVAVQGAGETTAWGSDLSLERMGPRAGIFVAGTVLPMTGTISGYRAPEDLAAGVKSARGLNYVAKTKISQLQFELGREPLSGGEYRPDFTGVRATHAASGGFEFAEESGVNPETLGLTQKALAQKKYWLFEGKLKPGMGMESEANWETKIPLGERILSNLPVVGVASQRLVPRQTLGIRPSFMESPQTWGYSGYQEPSVLRGRSIQESNFMGFGYGQPTQQRTEVVQVLKPRFTIKEIQFQRQVTIQEQEPEITYAQPQIQTQMVMQEVQQKQKQQSAQKQIATVMQEQKPISSQEIIAESISGQRQMPRQDLVFETIQEQQQEQKSATVQIQRLIGQTTETTEITIWDNIVRPPPPPPGIIPPWLPGGSGTSSPFGQRGERSWVETNPIAADLLKVGMGKRFRMPKMKPFRFRMPRF